MTKLIEVCDVQYGYPFDSKLFSELDGMPLIRIRDVVRGYSETFTTEDYKPEYVVHQGDILIGMDGEFNIAKWGEKPALLNQRVCRIFPKETVDSDYIFHALPKALKEIENRTAFVTVKHLSAKEINKITIPVPSLEKQRQIAAILNTLQSIITHRKQQLAKLDELVKARFVEMFGNPILNQKGFPVYRMDEVVDFQGGSQPDKKYFEYEPTEDNIRLIQIRDYKTDKYITYIPKAMAKRFCTADDIMIGRYGPPIFQILQGIEGSFNVALMKATPKMGNKEFIRYFLKQDYLLHYLEGLSQRTAGQDGIQMDKLKAYPFPMPPTEAQEEFATFIVQLNKSKVAVQKALDEAQLLFDSLMQEYFG